MIELTKKEIKKYYAAQVPELKQTVGQEWRGACPVHGGSRDSFSVNSETGFAHCYSQCDKGWDVFSLEEEIHGGPFAEAKARVFQIVGRDSEKQSKADEKAWSYRKPEKVYDYIDEDGVLQYQVLRYSDPKTFRQRRPVGNGKWAWSIKGLDPIPYRLQGVLQSQMVFVCEGEKDVDTLAEKGLVATCNNGGAGNFSPELAPFFDGKVVAILPDNDSKGHQHAIAVANILQNIAKTIKIVELPGVPDKGDITDWFNSGGTVDALRELYKNARYYKPIHPEDRWVKSFEETVEDAGGLQKFWDFTGQQGIPTPWKSLTDALGGGMLPTEVYGIIGNTGSGKTSLGLQFVTTALKSEAGVLIFSMEMDWRQVFQRLVAIEARVDLNEFRRRQVDGIPVTDDMRRLQAAQGPFTEAPLYVSTKPSITPSYIVEEGSRQKDLHKVDLIVVDHMQLMNADGRPGGEYERATSISRALKQAAKELRLPVLVMIQTKRRHGGPEGEELSIDDARGSGAIEEDLAGALLLFADAKDAKAAKDEQLAGGYTRLSKGPVKTWGKLGKARYGVENTYMAFDHWKRWARFDLQGEVDPTKYMQPTQQRIGGEDV